MIFEVPSLNWNERQSGMSVEYIIIHYTGTKTAEDAKERFLEVAPQDGVGRISPHYMIGEEGEIYKFVEEDKRAWHAGVSRWKNICDMNSASIGIEIWNSGHEYNFEEFLPVQIDTLIGLIADIRTRWAIPDRNILGHSDIAPGRKKDPGEKFPWRKLEINGIGLMPQIACNEEYSPQDFLDHPTKFYEGMIKFGYSDDVPMDVLLQEFRRHYVPKSFGCPVLDEETCMALLSLLGQVDESGSP
ncbi:MAG: N-acetylmuramoyl-L-alanine amidase [Pseudobdellovibrionaceae bacterium]|nr:N-acetylmuramoyl-L-alanine amidase [Pseudobdellovibrionaceae bacterium]